ncbi:hypothetical protein [Streptomyces sp. E5N91]|uniref:hypothetical protein n=1 Tax=Streptomyces sp. E5N91 TaxID=1851996 RepID=UPI00187D21C8|nr:hypothetical protein [Streptomyces sp. E5N91]
MIVSKKLASAMLRSSNGWQEIMSTWAGGGGPLADRQHGGIAALFHPRLRGGFGGT